MARREVHLPVHDYRIAGPYRPLRQYPMTCITRAVPPAFPSSLWARAWQYGQSVTRFSGSSLVLSRSRWWMCSVSVPKQIAHAWPSRTSTLSRIFFQAARAYFSFVVIFFPLSRHEIVPPRCDACGHKKQFFTKPFRPIRYLHRGGRDLSNCSKVVWWSFTCYSLSTMLPKTRSCNTRISLKSRFGYQSMEGFPDLNF
jgi:hypothetical protein